ncbi:polysaccharide deacetylase family protein [Rhodopirellula bahusiensis]|uniref:Chitooligosaccharide deacetylase n=1 Tax=Rhodopirellula bahusiensis TaxID=2014065 RepID=A0A2G1W3G1_9BACT|nr:polysaccharide deacetylase family protein [Rhodopirellula bahusiensis]PHQ33209.1 chitooligosaccharide deacetylase [Rhodopirellula bahusiensis]
MFFKSKLNCLLFLAASIAASTTTVAEEGYWPDGKTYCVTLTYDDGIPSQIAHALPQLKAAKMKGTFFCPGGVTYRWSQEDLDQIRDEGHELAGHTINHPCARKNDWVKPGNASEDYDDARMAKELDENLANLISNGVQSELATFAYPCGNTSIGEDKHSYVPLVKERFFAARGTQFGIEIPSQGDTDLFEVKTVAGHERDLAYQLDQVTNAREKQGWLVIMFHGVGGDHLAISADDHKEILRFLQNDDSVWVTTFQEAAAWVKSKPVATKTTAPAAADYGE